MSAPFIVASSKRDRLGEGPLWSDRDNAVYWVDILGQRLNRLSLADDNFESWNMPEPIGWVIERETKLGLIAGFRSGFAELELDPFRITPIVAPEPDRDDNRMNDAKADAQGRIWAGTMPMDCASPCGALYRLDPDRTVTQVDNGYYITNGPAFSVDGHWIYHTDTKRQIVFRFPINDDGTLGQRGPFILFEPEWGTPDGMTVDADGHLWIAHWGAGCVSRFTPEGKRERWISLPASQITSCTFAGPDVDRMFVTSAAEGVQEEHGGALFEVDPGCRGLPTCRFKG